MPRFNSLITADALHCQQESARFVTQDFGGDYMFGLKGNQCGILDRAQARLPQCFFSAEYDSGWEKDHGRLQRWRLQRVELSPEEAGLCGCWQFLAIWRERQKLRQGQVIEHTEEYSFYATSLGYDEHDAEALAGFIRGHWSACEIGSHYRRDVTMGEDASLIRGSRAHVMATLRNLVLGLFELQKDRGKASADYVPGWQRKMTPRQALELLRAKAI